MKGRRKKPKRPAKKPVQEIERLGMKLIRANLERDKALSGLLGEHWLTHLGKLRERIIEGRESNPELNPLRKFLY